MDQYRAKFGGVGVKVHSLSYFCQSRNFLKGFFLNLDFYDILIFPKNKKSLSPKNFCFFPSPKNFFVKMTPPTELCYLSLMIFSLFPFTSWFCFIFLSISQHSIFCNKTIFLSLFFLPLVFKGFFKLSIVFDIAF